MQALSHLWQPPTGFLGRILEEAQARVASLSLRSNELRDAASTATPAIPIVTALRQAHVAIIAEVKRRSPSRGDINPTLSAEARALGYAAGGAAAVSVLTEPTHFGGSTDDLRAVARALATPVLRKDFIVDEIQITEARAAGAAAVLLIARGLPPRQLSILLKSARYWGMEALVEVRTEDELEHAVNSGAALIGVNNRDLETLEMDLHTGRRLLPLIPSDLIAVSESGIISAEDVQRAADSGADAVLVGSSLSATTDPASAVAALTGVPRRRRGN
ncbi:MAG: indole-3-glycerol-phosphate synthase [Anaerolineae bacterium]|nr:indole-3-glycerol-phosphate synthase [Gemmatimonadaceae bacterium]